MNLDNLKYRFWYHYYKTANKLGLWKMYHSVDERTGIPYVACKWAWQEKPQDAVIFDGVDEL